MKNFSLAVSIFSLFVTIFVATPSFALEQIVRPYQGIRSSGMGGVMLSTGLYEDNFFGNPARTAKNPKFRFTLFDPMIEGNNKLKDSFNKLTASGDFLENLGNTAGNNNHVRVQTSMPALYFPEKEDGRMSFGFALLSSTQVDVDLRRSFEIDPFALTDIGPAFSVARSFMENKELTVGVTTHVTYRLATRKSFTFVDFIKGSSLSPLNSGGEGGMLDFDLGSTYVLPWKPSEFEFTPAITINNVLGGKYSNLGFKPLKIDSLPLEQPRTLGLGASARKATWWKFTDTVLAFEVREIGNNTDGSFYRLLHIGGETNFGRLAARLGINQGYWTAGLGLNLKILTLDFVTYGEEMALNPGGMEDRRYAAKVALQFE